MDIIEIIKLSTSFVKRSSKKKLRNISNKIAKKFKRLLILSNLCFVSRNLLVQVAQVVAHAFVYRKERGICGVALLTFRKSCATETAERRVRRP